MEESPISVSDTATASASCWSSVVKNQPPPNPPQPHTPQLLLQSCNSINGVSLAVVDANAVIDAGEKLHSFADKFVSVPEVMDEIRDPVSRHKLSFVPFSIETMEPSPESINKVVKFARATGDLQTLSDVDIKLIALTYTLEAQIHGTKHLRDIPPPVQMVNVKRLPEKELPGWGSNVPNLQEWEALENEAEEKSNSNSRILPLQDLNLNIVSRDDLSVDGSAEHKSETPSEIQEGGPSKPKKYQTKKRNINIEGKKMVADGVDASQGQFDDNAGDWMPAVSRSTHRRFLRRKARREYNEALSNQDQQELEENIDSSVKEDARASNQLVHQSDKEKHIGNAVNEDDMMLEENEGSESLSAVLKEMSLEEGLPELLDEDHKPNLCSAELLSNNAGLLETAFDGNVTMTAKPWETDTVNDQSNHLEIASQTSEATDFSYAADDGVKEDARASNQLVHQSDKEKHIGNAVNEDDMLIEENEGSESLSAVLKEMRLEEGLPELLDEDHKPNLCSAELLSNNAGLLETAFDGNVTMTTKPWETDTVNDQSNHLEIASQTSEATDFSYAADDDSEQSWALRSLSESSVACVTADFAMQNVLLQMGLRLLAPGGAQIHQLHRWILKCHACYTVTAEIGRIFCPKCGNGGTLRKVAVTVGENGIVLAARRPRVTLRGTKFSLPLPKGGRDAVTKNLILREDQLPQRVLYPKTKKKGNKQNDDFFTPDSVFSHHTDKKAPFQPPIRKALAVFGGKRNPNDNHYSRSKHK